MTPPSSAQPVVNDFTIGVATVNGSGSASSNTILAKTVFHMGVPVAPKNFFPSNIAGLPTWFLIRVNEQGYRCIGARTQFMVAVNPATAAEDIASVEPGGVLVIDEKIPQAKDIGRDDLIVYSVPMADIARGFGPDPRLRKLLANMVYVGVVAELVGLDRAVLEQVVNQQFASKQKVVELNLKVVDAGIEYAREHFADTACPYRIESRDLTGDKMLVEGNQATALGALMGGCTVVAWYPITPSTSVCEEFIKLCKEHRVDAETGEARFASLQAEDELASMGLVLGAGWAGARAMTATSGPGISLMSELAGYGYYAEIPGVVIDVQRVGPSTGMPTRTQQGDILMCATLSHGDTNHIVLLPAGPEEIYEHARMSFDLAERFQTPVFLLTDLDMGMNLWMSDKFTYPEGALDRGKVLDKEALEKAGSFQRYADIDGDGVPYRTLPGTRHPLAPYFTRGSGHTAAAEYTEDGDEYQEVVDRIKRKIENSTSATPAPVLEDADSEVGIIHYGSTSFAVEEARHRLDAAGIKTRSLRLRSLPLHDAVVEFIDECRVVYVAEQNRDGQMADLIRLKVPGSAAKIRKLLHYNGRPIPARAVEEGVLAGEREPAHA